jgi:phage tail-like protein
VGVADPQLLRSFRFRVKLLRSPAAVSGSTDPSAATLPTGSQLGDGGFQECSGLEVDMEVLEYHEGGRNDGVIRRAGRAKYVELVLKRGMLFSDGGSVNAELWSWLQGVVAGVRPVQRYDGIVEVLDGSGPAAVGRWVFTRGLPAKVTGPALNARTGDVAIEELRIAHEGLRLVQ